MLLRPLKINRCAATFVATGLLFLVGCGSGNQRGGDNVSGANSAVPTPPKPLSKRHVIIMIADGWGYQHIAATKSYSGANPPYAGFDSLAMTTWDLDTEKINGSPAYDPNLAWNKLGYLTAASTDSASSATAMFTGVKTDRGRISTGPGVTGIRLETLAEMAHDRGFAVGTVSSVPLSHATPAAWTAHNDSRIYYRTVADELLFGDPSATGNPDGGHGVTGWVPDVLLAGGHPLTGGETFMTHVQRTRARAARFRLGLRRALGRGRPRPAGDAGALAPQGANCDPIARRVRRSGRQPSVRPARWQWPGSRGAHTRRNDSGGIDRARIKSSRFCVDDRGRSRRLGWP